WSLSRSRVTVYLPRKLVSASFSRDRSSAYRMSDEVRPVLVEHVIERRQEIFDWSFTGLNPLDKHGRPRTFDQAPSPAKNVHFHASPSILMKSMTSKFKSSRAHIGTRSVSFGPYDTG